MKNLVGYFLWLIFPFLRFSFPKRYNAQFLFLYYGNIWYFCSVNI